MKKLFNILKEKLAPLSSKLQSLKSILPQKKPHSEKYYKRIAFLNKYSLIFHFLLACLLILAVETISRRDFVSAITFISNHTLAFLYNALIIFASLSLVYLTKYRTQMRILISGLWIFLGTVNGLILSNRVTPFSYTDLKCLPDLFAMQNTNYFTAEEATMVVSVVVAFFVILGLLFAKGPRYQGKRHTVLGPVSIAALILIGLPITTQAAQSSNILASYFANIAQGYSDYGFVYGFSTSVVGRGMDKPEDYSEETVIIVSLLPHITECHTSVFARIVKGRIHKEIADSECMHIDIRILLQIVPNIHRVVFLFKAAQKSERKAAGIHLHVVLDKSKSRTLNYRLNSTPRKTSWVCPYIIITGKVDVRQPI